MDRLWQQKIAAKNETLFILSATWLLSRMMPVSVNANGNEDLHSVPGKYIILEKGFSQWIMV
jgi:hypothetical protein